MEPPKYTNGREARVGDVILGKGTTFKHGVIGVLVKIQRPRHHDGLVYGVVCCTGVRPGGHGVLASRPLMLVSGNEVAFEDAFPRVEAVLEFVDISKVHALSPED